MAKSEQELFQEQQEQAAKMYEAVLGKVSELLHRTPLQPGQLVQALVEKDWPSEARIHPADFWVLTAQGALPWVTPFQVYKDSDGPYFYVSRTRVRPQPTTSVVVDLSDWTPPEQRLIQPAAFAGAGAERKIRGLK